METEVGSRRRSKLATRSAARKPPAAVDRSRDRAARSRTLAGGAPEIFEADTFEIVRVNRFSQPQLRDGPAFQSTNWRWRDTSRMSRCRLRQRLALATVSSYL
jgi:hypothetical protein